MRSHVSMLSHSASRLLAVLGARVVVDYDNPCLAYFYIRNEILMIFVKIISQVQQLVGYHQNMFFEKYDVQDLTE